MVIKHELQIYFFDWIEIKNLNKEAAKKFKKEDLYKKLIQKKWCKIKIEKVDLQKKSILNDKIKSEEFDIAFLSKEDLAKICMIKNNQKNADINYEENKNDYI